MHEEQVARLVALLKNLGVDLWTNDDWRDELMCSGDAMELSLEQVLTAAISQPESLTIGRSRVFKVRAGAWQPRISRLAPLILPLPKRRTLAGKRSGLLALFRCRRGFCCIQWRLMTPRCSCKPS